MSRESEAGKSNQYNTQNTHLLFAFLFTEGKKRAPSSLRQKAKTQL
jgi:hypothetical protein